MPARGGMRSGRGAGTTSTAAGACLASSSAILLSAAARSSFSLAVVVWSGFVEDGGEDIMSSFTILRICLVVRSHRLGHVLLLMPRRNQAPYQLVAVLFTQVPAPQLVQVHPCFSSLDGGEGAIYNAVGDCEMESLSIIDVFAI